MIEVVGSNLGGRQFHLNHIVNEFAINKINFDEVKDLTETNDLDKLFKIDLAAKYKTIEYIIETLKSGDSLYITRALKKSLWLYDDEYSNIVNPDYLHHNIFPSMSIKMKNKFLSTVAMHTSNEARAEEFYKYCMLQKLTNIADKYLVKTSEIYKLNHLQNHKINDDIKYLNFFIGNSFTLLETYLMKLSEWRRSNFVKEFQHLYSVSATQYLDMLEKFAYTEQRSKKILGLRISKDIMTKHKDRVLAKPKFYLNILNMTKIVRHSKPDQAQEYILKIMPKGIEDFWNINFYQTYKPIIDLIPAEKRYVFIKKLFCENFPGQEFEMSKNFFDQKYYNLMSPSEQEVWALRQIASGKELLGAGNDYIWYKFVNFETAFEENKKIINKTRDQMKRGDILKILVEATKNQADLIKLLSYYNDRHINENKNSKEQFLRKVMSCHKVFEFEESCWNTFDKVLASIHVYNTSGHSCNPDFKNLSVVYHILNKKELPEALTQYLDKDMSSHSFRIIIKDLDAAKKQIIYDYIFDFYVTKIEQLNADGDASDLEVVKSKVSIYIYFILELMAVYNKTKKDIPDVIMEFVKLDWKSYKYQQIFQGGSEDVINEQMLLKLLKIDAILPVGQIATIKNEARDRRNLRITKFLQKIKIFFPNDVAKEYLKLFHELLLEKNLYNCVASSAVFGIFQLSEDDENVDFMRKYKPESAKIDHNNLPSALLNIQENICRFACYSRKPVPLTEMLEYMKGDYVQYCLPLFNRYLSNLPQPLCFKFVEALINAPVSIQKHGLRLAFRCFNGENLKTLILDAWNRTKNVSLRSVIYRAFLNKTIEEGSSELFEVLKTLTFDLNEDDDDELFGILTSNKLPRQFLGEFIEAVWNTVNSFSFKETNLKRKASVISCMDRNLHAMKKETMTKMVQDFVNTLLKKNMIETDEINYLVSTKWELIAHYLVFSTSSKHEQQENVAMTKSIMRYLLDNWNVDFNNVFVNRRLCLEFICKLIEKSYWSESFDYRNANPILEAVVEDLSKTLPLNEIYMIEWQLRLVINNRNLIEEGKAKGSPNNDGVIMEVAAKFGRVIGNIVKEYIDKKKFCTHFSPKIAELINSYVCNILTYIQTDNTVKSDNASLAVARGLLDVDIVETYILALQVLPDDLDDSDHGIMDELKILIEKMKAKGDIELLCLINDKYYRDCKRRRFM